MTDLMFFDDLHVGDRWVSPSRTVTETDVISFACLSGDFDPLHTDHEYAKKTPFGRPIAHGLLGAAFVAGLSLNSPRVKTEALVSIKHLRFLKPIFFGDTVHVVNEIMELQALGKNRGVVIWRRRLINQRGEITQEGILETLVATSDLARRNGFMPPASQPAPAAEPTVSPTG